MNNNKYTTIEIRDVKFSLMTYTRSLELCSRMNYETENLDFIDKINEGEILFDLGACEGRFSIYAAKKGIRVYSFEPEAKNFSVFKQNIELNNISSSQITPINAGVGSNNSNAIIKIGQPWEGGHQKVVEHDEIRQDLNFDFVETQNIKIISLDSFCEEYQINPDYLKIDIDGSEVPFLKGALKTLKNKNLKGIIFELSDIDPNFKSIIEKLNEDCFLEVERFEVPNEPNLFNIIFMKK